MTCEGRDEPESHSIETHEVVSAIHDRNSSGRIFTPCSCRIRLVCFFCSRRLFTPKKYAWYLSREGYLYCFYKTQEQMSVDSIRHRRLRFESVFTFPERAARFRREQDRSKEPLSWVIRSDSKPAPRRTGGLWAMRPARTLRVHSFFAHATCHPWRRRLERVVTVEVVAPGPSDRQSVLWGYF